MTLRALLPSVRLGARPSSKLRVWSLIELFRQRQALAKLSDHELEDVGLTPREAQAEASRLLLDVPAHWRK